MVPTSMFMGQVVTAYNPFTGQQVGTKQHRRIVLWFLIGIVQSVCVLVLTQICFKKNKNKIKVMFKGWVTFHLGLFGLGK